jgi:flagellar biosynthesis protein
MEASELKSKKARKHSVALAYDKSDKAPRVVASGSGEIAKKILELAQEHNIPVKQDDSLIDLLARLELRAEIPEIAYRAVATILAFLYRTEEEWKVHRLTDMQEPADVNASKNL